MIGITELFFEITIDKNKNIKTLPIFIKQSRETTLSLILLKAHN